MAKPTAHEIDALLPQTQCGLCNYGGCMPYAEAMVEQGAAINLCPPGGVKTLKALAQKLAVDATPFLAEMQAKAKPAAVVDIKEDQCIGCTKCIQVCPVDAIVGAAKLMHSVLTSECTGCELCIPACPVDCIDVIENIEAIDKQKSDYFRLRYNARTERLAKVARTKSIALHSKNKTKLSAYVAAALARVKANKTG